ncbi:TauD/TfdA family dioxygenase [Pseudomonas peli]|uniref:TauD/TfdA family dioxygenase n=1 Tax=Pseudomonas peli TaxID=592361 RepID=UPI0024AD710C|nr:TauD/TfdA family dioxygenase [Pseudomonas peli]
MALLCLRSRAAAPATLVSDVRAVVVSLPLEIVKVLSEVRFLISDDVELNLNQHSARKKAILEFSGDLLTRVNYDHDLIRPLDKEAFLAAREFQKCVERFAVAVTLERGDLLVIDNRISVHSRMPFKPEFDGYDRWLQSTYVKRDIPRKYIDSVKLSPSC